MPVDPVGVPPEPVPGELGGGSAVVGLLVNPVVPSRDGLVVHPSTHTHAGVEGRLHVLPVIPELERVVLMTSRVK